MRVQISDHQDKSQALKEALAHYGHEIVYTDPEVLLIDFDGPVAHYPKTIERAYERGAAVFLYSHGAMPLTCWDGIWTPSDKVSGFLAQTPGQKAVMEAYHYPHPVHVIGWHYTDQYPFEQTTGKRVLFAPWHPQGTGWLIPEGRAANARMYKLLTQIPGINLTIRHAGNLADNNLPFDPVVTKYERSNKSLDTSVESILNYDIIIGYGTFAYLSVALGKPTVMYGQNCVPYDGYSAETCAYVKHWDWYSHLMHYPHDGDVDNVWQLMAVMDKACKEEATEWRREFIGEQFKEREFCDLLEKLVREVDYA